MLSKVFKIARWTFCILVIHLLYSWFLMANFMSYPTWAVPVDWLAQKFFCGEFCDGESGIDAAENAMVSVAAIHLIVIAIITGLVYLGFRWRKRHRGQS